MNKPVGETQAQVVEQEAPCEALLVPRYVTRFAGHGEACRERACTELKRSGEGAAAAVLNQLVHFGDCHQSALSLACPEAARLALLAEDAFEMEALELPFEPQRPFEALTAVPTESLEVVRTEMFQILLTRELPLARRLAILGLFSQRLTELLSEGKIANLPGLIQAMDSIIENEGLQIPLMVPTQREDVQAKLVGHFLLLVRKAELDARQRVPFDAASGGLGVTVEGLGDARRLKAGMERGQAQLARALESFPWFFENYLSNELFRELFPWAGRSPFEHFARVLRRFTLLRALLVGRAASQPEPLSPEALVETVQVFSQVIEADESLLDRLDEELTGLNWNSLGILLLLV